MKFIKTPLRYPGGKSRAADTIISYFPQFDSYAEPFVGGGSVFIKTKQLFPDKQYWINDLFFDLYCFWEQIQNNNTETLQQILAWKNEFQNGKELYDFLTKNQSTFNPMQKAAAFFILNRITFSGTSLSGGFSQQAFDGRFNKQAIDRIENIIPLLQNTKITNMDYQSVIESLPQNTFAFLDPPYYSNTKSLLYGPKGELHKTFDHDKLFHILSQSKNKWLLTYDNSDYIKSLYKNYNILPLNFTYGMKNVVQNSDMNANEIIIKNY